MATASPSLTILVSSRFTSHQVVSLQKAFPEHRFVPLAADGAVPVDARDAAIVFRCGMPRPALSRVLQEAPGVRWVATCTAGVEWLMVPEVAERKIPISRSSTMASQPIAEFSLAAIFALAKRHPDLYRAQQSRTWMPHDDPQPIEIVGSTVGIVGTGAIGKELAWRCKAVGMRVLGMKRNPEPLEHFDRVDGPDALHAIMAESDFVVVATPLTDETRGLLGRAQLRTMKPTAYLVNIARGAVTVEPELIQALEEGVIAGAWIDAFVDEPLPSDSPFWTARNCIVSPHYSYASPHGIDRAVEEFKENLRRFVAGEPLMNVYDWDRGY